MRKGNMTILASVIAIGLVMMGVGMGTMAWFSDTVTSKDNVFTSGTLDIMFDLNPDGDKQFWIDDTYDDLFKGLPKLQDFYSEVKTMAPNDTLYTMLGIANAGTMDGIPSLQFTNVGGMLADVITVEISYGYDIPGYDTALGIWETAADAWILDNAGYVGGVPGTGPTRHDFAILFSEADRFIVGLGDGTVPKPYDYEENYFGTITLENAIGKTWYAPSDMELQAGATNERNSGFWRLDFHFEEGSGNEYQDKKVWFDIVFGLNQVQTTP